MRTSMRVGGCPHLRFGAARVVADRDPAYLGVMNVRAIYIECDIPPGMTCAEYRRVRSATRRREQRRHRIRFRRRR